MIIVCKAGRYSVMYEDEYYYEARKKENAKLDAELAGTFATVIMLNIFAKEI